MTLPEAPHSPHGVCPDVGASLRGAHRRKQKRGTEQPVRFAKSAQAQQPGRAHLTLCCCRAHAAAVLADYLLWRPAIVILPPDCTAQLLLLLLLFLRGFCY